MKRKNPLRNKVVLVSGGTGSLGKALVRRLLEKHKPKKVIVYSRCEFKQSEMAKDFADFDRLRFFLGDVRDKERLNRVCAGVDIVVHAAALKQIPALEYNPTEAIKTNVLGSMNVIEACIENRVKKAVLISTDKAVNPINLYGATKLAAEKLFMAANSYNKTSFSCVRYGNVIGSRGSVIPLFQSLKEKGVKEFPITDKEMTRFWITLPEAVDLVITALTSANKKILVPRIPSMKIVDVAKAVDPDCTIKEIGIRPGEKMNECLVSEDNRDVCVIDSNKIYSAEPYYSDKNNLWLSPEGLREKI